MNLLHIYVWHTSVLHRSTILIKFAHSFLALQDELTYQRKAELKLAVHCVRRRGRRLFGWIIGRWINSVQVERKQPCNCSDLKGPGYLVGEIETCTFLFFGIEERVHQKNYLEQ